MVYNSHINILDAIGLAGDLTINGTRKEIMLIRHSIPDKIVYLDLTNINLIHSDYYYLSPDDIIYIKPLRAKYFGTNPFPIATILSVFTTVLLLINYFKK
jgi:polysaccharide export outer membrane protein